MENHLSIEKRLELYDASEFEIRRLGRIQELIRQWIKRGERVLEIGAGLGHFTSELCTVGARVEIVEPDLRKLVKEVLGVALIDTYSARELGYIALQCSENEHYHIQSENVFIEIINEQGLPCKIGEVQNPWTGLEVIPYSKNYIPNCYDGTLIDVK